MAEVPAAECALCVLWSPLTDVPQQTLQDLVNSSPCLSNVRLHNNRLLVDARLQPTEDMDALVYHIETEHRIEFRVAYLAQHDACEPLFADETELHHLALDQRASPPQTFYPSHLVTVSQPNHVWCETQAAAVAFQQLMDEVARARYPRSCRVLSAVKPNMDEDHTQRLFAEILESCSPSPWVDSICQTTNRFVIFTIALSDEKAQLLCHHINQTFPSVSFTAAVKKSLSSVVSMRFATLDHVNRIISQQSPALGTYSVIALEVGPRQEEVIWCDKEATAARVLEVLKAYARAQQSAILLPGAESASLDKNDSAVYWSTFTQKVKLVTDAARKLITSHPHVHPTTRCDPDPIGKGVRILAPVHPSAAKTLRQYCCDVNEEGTRPCITLEQAATLYRDVISAQRHLRGESCPPTMDAVVVCPFPPDANPFNEPFQVTLMQSLAASPDQRNHAQIRRDTALLCLEAFFASGSLGIGDPLESHAITPDQVASFARSWLLSQTGIKAVVALGCEWLIQIVESDGTARTPWEAFAALPNNRRPQFVDVETRTSLLGNCHFATVTPLSPNATQGPIAQPYHAQPLFCTVFDGDDALLENRDAEITAACLLQRDVQTYWPMYRYIEVVREAASPQSLKITRTFTDAQHHNAASDILSGREDDFIRRVEDLLLQLAQLHATGFALGCVSLAFMALTAKGRLTFTTLVFVRHYSNRRRPLRPEPKLDVPFSDGAKGHFSGDIWAIGCLVAMYAARGNWRVGPVANVALTTALVSSVGMDLKRRPEQLPTAVELLWLRRNRFVPEDDPIHRTSLWNKPSDITSKIAQAASIEELQFCRICLECRLTIAQYYSAAYQLVPLLDRFLGVCNDPTMTSLSWRILSETQGKTSLPLPIVATTIGELCLGGSTARYKHAELYQASDLTVASSIAEALFRRGDSRASSWLHKAKEQLERVLDLTTTYHGTIACLLDDKLSRQPSTWIPYALQRVVGDTYNTLQTLREVCLQPHASLLVKALVLAFLRRRADHPPEIVDLIRECSAQGLADDVDSFFSSPISPKVPPKVQNVVNVDSFHSKVCSVVSSGVTAASMEELLKGLESSKGMDLTKAQIVVQEFLAHSEIDGQLAVVGLRVAATYNIAVSDEVKTKALAVADRLLRKLFGTAPPLGLEIYFCDLRLGSCAANADKMTAYFSPHSVLKLAATAVTSKSSKGFNELLNHAVTGFGLHWTEAASITMKTCCSIEIALDAIETLRLPTQESADLFWREIPFMRAVSNGEVVQAWTASDSEAFWKGADKRGLKEVAMKLKFIQNCGSFIQFHGISFAGMDHSNPLLLEPVCLEWPECASRVAKLWVESLSEPKKVRDPKSYYFYKEMPNPKRALIQLVNQRTLAESFVAELDLSRHNCKNVTETEALQLLRFLDSQWPLQVVEDLLQCVISVSDRLTSSLEKLSGALQMLRALPPESRVKKVRLLGSLKAPETRIASLPPLINDLYLDGTNVCFTGHWLVEWIVHWLTHNAAENSLLLFEALNAPVDMASNLKLASAPVSECSFAVAAWTGLALRTYQHGDAVLTPQTLVSKHFTALQHLRQNNQVEALQLLLSSNLDLLHDSSANLANVLQHLSDPNLSFDDFTVKKGEALFWLRLCETNDAVDVNLGPSAKERIDLQVAKFASARECWQLSLQQLHWLTSSFSGIDNTIKDRFATVMAAPTLDKASINSLLETSCQAVTLFKECIGEENEVAAQALFCGTRTSVLSAKMLIQVKQQDSSGSIWNAARCSTLMKKLLGKLRNIVTGSVEGITLPELPNLDVDNEVALFSSAFPDATLQSLPTVLAAPCACDRVEDVLRGLRCVRALHPECPDFRSMQSLASSKRVGPEHGNVVPMLANMKAEHVAFLRQLGHADNVVRFIMSLKDESPGAPRDGNEANASTSALESYLRRVTNVLNLYGVGAQNDPDYRRLLNLQHFLPALWHLPIREAQTTLESAFGKAFNEHAAPFNNVAAIDQLTREIKNINPDILDLAQIVETNGAASSTQRLRNTLNQMCDHRCFYCVEVKHGEKNFRLEMEDVEGHRKHAVCLTPLVNADLQRFVESVARCFQVPKGENRAAEPPSREALISDVLERLHEVVETYAEFARQLSLAGHPKYAEVRQEFPLQADQVEVADREGTELQSTLVSWLQAIDAARQTQPLLTLIPLPGIPNLLKAVPLHAADVPELPDNSAELSESNPVAKLRDAFEKCARTTLRRRGAKAELRAAARHLRALVINRAEENFSECLVLLGAFVSAVCESPQLSSLLAVKADFQHPFVLSFNADSSGSEHDSPASWALQKWIMTTDRPPLPFEVLACRSSTTRIEVESFFKAADQFPGGNFLLAHAQQLSHEAKKVLAVALHGAHQGFAARVTIITSTEHASTLPLVSPPETVRAPIPIDAFLQCIKIKHPQRIRATCVVGPHGSGKTHEVRRAATAGTLTVQLDGFVNQSTACEALRSSNAARPVLITPEAFKRSIDDDYFDRGAFAVDWLMMHLIIFKFVTDGVERVDVDDATTWYVEIPSLHSWSSGKPPVPVGVQHVARWLPCTAAFGSIKILTCDNLIDRLDINDLHPLGDGSLALPTDDEVLCDSSVAGPAFVAAMLQFLTSVDMMRTAFPCVKHRENDVVPMLYSHIRLNITTFDAARFELRQVKLLTSCCTFYELVAALAVLRERLVPLARVPKIPMLLSQGSCTQSSLCAQGNQCRHAVQNVTPLVANQLVPALLKSVKSVTEPLTVATLSKMNVFVVDPAGGHFFPFKGAEQPIMDLGDPLAHFCYGAQWNVFMENGQPATAEDVYAKALGRIVGENCEISADHVKAALKEVQFVMNDDQVARAALLVDRMRAGQNVVILSETATGKTTLQTLLSILINTDARRKVSVELHSAIARYIATIYERNTEHLALPADKTSAEDQLATLLTIEGIVPDELCQELCEHVKNDHNVPAGSTFVSEREFVELSRVLQAHDPNNADSFKTIRSRISKFLDAATTPVFPVSTFYHKKLMHHGISHDAFVNFFGDIVQRAENTPTFRHVVFLDELNAAGSLVGMLVTLVKDRLFQGKLLPPNVFITAAINPDSRQLRLLLQDKTAGSYVVEQVSPSLDLLTVIFAPQNERDRFNFIGRLLSDGIVKHNVNDAERHALAKLITETHAKLAEFSSKVGPVTQRSIKFATNMTRTLYTLLKAAVGGDEKKLNPREDLVKCIVTATYFAYVAGCAPLTNVAVRDDPEAAKEPRRAVQARMNELLKMDDFAYMGRTRDVVHIANSVCDRIVNSTTFAIPSGIALTESMKQMLLLNLISALSDVPHIPISFVGEPGLGKTQSVHILAANMKGSLSTTQFFRDLGIELTVMWLQGSSTTTGEHVAAVMERAIEIQRNKPEKLRVIVAFDEAGLSLDKLKAMHQYQDEGLIGFIALSNRDFDAANQNRMLTYRRDVRLADDLRQRAYGCLGSNENQLEHVAHVIDGVTDIIVRLSQCEKDDPLYGLSKRYHMRNFVYLWRCIKQMVPKLAEGVHITSTHLLRALEYNFGGVPQAEFERLVQQVYVAIKDSLPLVRDSPDEWNPPSPADFRDVRQIIRDSLNRAPPSEIHLRPRFKMFVDPSDNFVVAEATLNEMFPHTARRDIWLSNAPEDATALGDSRAVAELIYCMENGHLAVITNGDRIHGHLFDVYNQHYSEHKHEEDGVEKTSYFCRVSAGAETREVIVHPQFSVVVVMTKSAYDQYATKADGAFLSRFEIFLLPNKSAGVSELALQRSLEFIPVMGAHNLKAFDQHTTPNLIAQAAGSFTLAADVPATLTPELHDAWKLNSMILELLPPEVALLRFNSVTRKQEMWAEYLAQGHTDLRSTLKSHQRRHSSKHLLVYTEDRMGLHTLTNLHDREVQDRFGLTSVTYALDVDRFAKERLLRQYLERCLQRGGFLLIASRSRLDGERINRLRHVVNQCLAAAAGISTTLARVVLLVVPENSSAQHVDSCGVATMSASHRAVFSSTWTSTYVDQVIANVDLEMALQRIANHEMDVDPLTDEAERDEFQNFLSAAEYSTTYLLHDAREVFGDDGLLALQFYATPGPTRLLSALDAMPGVTLRLAQVLRPQRSARRHRKELLDAATATTQRLAVPPLAAVFKKQAQKQRQYRATRVAKLITANFGLANLTLAHRKGYVELALNLIRLVGQSEQRMSFLERNAQGAVPLKCCLNPWLEALIRPALSKQKTSKRLRTIRTTIDSILPNMDAEVRNLLNALPDDVVDAYCSDILETEVLRHSECLKSLSVTGIARIREAAEGDHANKKCAQCLYATLLQQFPLDREQLIGSLVFSAIWSKLQLDLVEYPEDRKSTAQFVISGIVKKLQNAVRDFQVSMASVLNNCSTVFDMLTTWLVPRRAKTDLPAAVGHLLTKLEWLFVAVNITRDSGVEDETTLRSLVTSAIVEPDAGVSSIPFDCSVVHNLTHEHLINSQQETSAFLHFAFLHIAEAPDRLFNAKHPDFSLPRWLRMTQYNFGLTRALLQRFVDVDDETQRADLLRALFHLIQSVTGAEPEQDCSLLDASATPLQTAATAAFYDVLERRGAHVPASIKRTLVVIKWALEISQDGTDAASNAVTAACAWYVAVELVKLYKAICTDAASREAWLASLKTELTTELNAGNAALLYLMASHGRPMVISITLQSLSGAEASNWFAALASLPGGEGFEAFSATEAVEVDGTYRPVRMAKRIPARIISHSNDSLHVAYIALREHVLAGSISDALLEQHAAQHNPSDVSLVLMMSYVVDVVFGMSGACTAAVTTNARHLSESETVAGLLNWTELHKNLLQLILFPSERNQLVRHQLRLGDLSLLDPSGGFTLHYLEATTGPDADARYDTLIALVFALHNSESRDHQHFRFALEQSGQLKSKFAFADFYHSREMIHGFDCGANFATSPEGKCPVACPLKQASDRRLALYTTYMMLMGSIVLQPDYISAMANTSVSNSIIAQINLEWRQMIAAAEAENDNQTVVKLRAAALDGTREGQARCVVCAVARKLSEMRGDLTRHFAVASIDLSSLVASLADLSTRQTDSSCGFYPDDERRNAEYAAFLPLVRTSMLTALGEQEDTTAQRVRRLNGFRSTAAWMISEASGVKLQNVLTTLPRLLVCLRCLNPVASLYHTLHTIVSQHKSLEELTEDFTLRQVAQEFRIKRKGDVAEIVDAGIKAFAVINEELRVIDFECGANQVLPQISLDTCVKYLVSCDQIPDKPGENGQVDGLLLDTITALLQTSEKLARATWPDDQLSLPDIEGEWDLSAAALWCLPLKAGPLDSDWGRHADLLLLACLSPMQDVGSANLQLDETPLERFINRCYLGPVRLSSRLSKQHFRMVYPTKVAPQILAQKAEACSEVLRLWSLSCPRPMLSPALADAANESPQLADLIEELQSVTLRAHAEDLPTTTALLDLLSGSLKQFFLDLIPPDFQLGQTKYVMDIMKAIHERNVANAEVVHRDLPPACSADPPEGARKDVADVLEAKITSCTLASELGDLIQTLDEAKASIIKATTNMPLVATLADVGEITCVDLLGLFDGFTLQHGVMALRVLHEAWSTAQARWQALSTDEYDVEAGCMRREGSTHVAPASEDGEDDLSMSAKDELIDAESHQSSEDDTEMEEDADAEDVPSEVAPEVAESRVMEQNLEELAGRYTTTHTRKTLSRDVAARIARVWRRRAQKQRSLVLHLSARRPWVPASDPSLWPRCRGLCPTAASTNLVFVNTTAHRTAWTAASHDMSNATWPASWKAFHARFVQNERMVVAHCSGFIWHQLDVSPSSTMNDPRLERTLILMDPRTPEDRSVTRQFCRDGKSPAPVRALPKSRLCDVATVVACIKKMPNFVVAVDFTSKEIIPGDTLFENVPDQFGLVSVTLPPTIVTATLRQHTHRTSSADSRPIFVLDSTPCDDVAVKLTGLDYVCVRGDPTFTCVAALDGLDEVFLDIADHRCVSVRFDNQEPVAIRATSPLELTEGATWCRQVDGKYERAVPPFVEGDCFTSCRNWRLKRRSVDHAVVTFRAWIPIAVETPSEFLQIVGDEVDGGVLLHHRQFDSKSLRLPLVDGEDVMSFLQPPTVTVARRNDLVRVDVGSKQVIVHRDDTTDAVLVYLQTAGRMQSAIELAWRKVIVTNRPCGPVRLSYLTACGGRSGIQEAHVDPQLQPSDDDEHPEAAEEQQLAPSDDDEQLPSTVESAVMPAPKTKDEEEEDEEEEKEDHDDADSIQLLGSDDEGAGPVRRSSVKLTAEFSDIAVVHLEVITDESRIRTDVVQLDDIFARTEGSSAFYGVLPALPLRCNSSSKVQLAWIAGEVSSRQLGIGLQIQHPFVPQLLEACGIEIGVLNERLVFASARVDRLVALRLIPVTVLCGLTDRFLVGVITMEVPLLVDAPEDPTGVQYRDIGCTALRALGLPLAALHAAMYCCGNESGEFVSVAADTNVMHNISELRVQLVGLVAHSSLLYCTSFSPSTINPVFEAPVSLRRPTDFERELYPRAVEL